MGDLHNQSEIRLLVVRISHLSCGQLAPVLFSHIQGLFLAVDVPILHTSWRWAAPMRFLHECGRAS